MCDSCKQIKELTERVKQLEEIQKLYLKLLSQHQQMLELNLVSVKEVEGLINGGGSGRVQR
jgi:hypothetical protein